MRGTLWSYPEMPLKTLGAAFATTVDGRSYPESGKGLKIVSVEDDPKGYQDTLEWALPATK